MAWKKGEDLDDEWNWLRGQPNAQYAELAENDPEYAESWKKNHPETYYSWDWTPLPDEGDVPDEWWDYHWTPDRPEKESE